MSVEKGLIGSEDVQFGTGTYERKGKSGQNIVLSKVNASHLPIPDSGDIFTSENVEDALQECQVQNGIGSLSKDYTNKSGGARELGDVVLIDTDNDEAFEVTATANSSLVLGVVAEDIANNESGKVIAGGYINEIKVTGATARGSYLQTSTSSAQAQSSATFDVGSFAIALSSTAGAGTVSALVFGSVAGSYLPLDGGTMAGEFLSAGRRLGYVSKSAAYQTVDTDEIIDVTAGVGGVTLTLHTSGIAKSGKRWIVRNVDGGVGNVTIATEGSETINGSATKVLTRQNDVAILYSDGTNVMETSSAGEGYILVQDQKATGTDGGTFTNGAWRTRDLNTEMHDTGGDASVSSNQITLKAGTYKVRASAPCWSVGKNVAKIYDTTGAADLVIGSGAYASTTTGSEVIAEVVGRFTIAVESVIELQHYGTTTKASTGFGVNNNFTSFEVFSSVELWKEA